MTNTTPTPSVSIQGYQGSFHHLAAVQYWGEQVTLVERSRFMEVYADVVAGRVDYGLAAIENTIAGVVTESLDQLLSQQVVAIGEVTVPVVQNLIVIPGTSLSELKRIYSHPVALLQCQEFFGQHPDIELIATDDTGKSVDRMMKHGDLSAGSVASVLAAQLFGAQVLVPNIQSSTANFTRFLILQKLGTLNDHVVTGKQKLILALYLAHEPGSLARCLTLLAETGCNLMKIESRPIQGKPWEYVMYLELTAQHTQSEWSVVISQLRAMTQKVLELGRFAVE